MIKYFGHSMFVIDDKIIIDPHDGGSIGLEKPSISNSDLILITHDHYDHNAYQLFKYNDLKIKYYGEINYQGYKITGYKAYHDKVHGKRRGETAIYKIQKPDGITIVHLGDIGEQPDEKLLKEISNPDVLMIPVGGLITINYSEAVNIIQDLKPSIIFPMHYWVKGLLMPLDPIDNFLNEMKKTKYNIKEYKKEINENEDKESIFFRV
ncbi:hydrolase [Acidianus sulfidivorans JP7]|uniref:Hydrolase n=1 Tax=Acidianus sulfidivorans JP7 TaxID=619593 RepID=A0A2U9IKS5_9CREN|nr:MBL fold metallo-hydrolase [Acidianus sulfidivorans]AWR96639.1 hydrolase [Acidianus sulfidivorans JP7]